MRLSPSGGDDQWSNIIAGAELIRRKDRETCVRHDFLTTASGEKRARRAALSARREQMFSLRLLPVLEKCQDELSRGLCVS